MPANAIITTSTMPKVPSGCRRQKISPRRKSERWISVTSSMTAETAAGEDAAIVMANSGVADAGVEPGVDQIDDGVGQHEDSDDQHHQCLGHRIVLVLDRLHEEAADAVEIEYLLGHHEAADQKCRLDADQGHDRQQSVLQRMPVDDDPLDQAFGPRGADVILAQDFEHRRAGHPHRHGGSAVADGQCRPDRHRQVADRVLPYRDIVDRRHPWRAKYGLRDVENGEDQQNAEPERGCGKTGDRDRADHQIDRAVLLQRRDRAERDRDDVRDHHRQNADLEGDREARGNFVGDGLARPHRGAEIAAEKAPYEIDELEEDRAIEAELGMAGGNRSFIEAAATGAEPYDADVAGDQAHQQKDERRRSDKGRDHQQYPLHDVSIHRLRSFLPSYPRQRLTIYVPATPYLSSHTVDKS